MFGKYSCLELIKLLLLRYLTGKEFIFSPGLQGFGSNTLTKYETL